MVFVTNMQNDMHSERANIPISRDGRKNLHDLHRYPSKEKKKGRRDCTFKFAHDHVIEKDAFIREKKIAKDMLTLEQNIWIIIKLSKVT